MASHSTASRPRDGRHSSGRANRKVAFSAVVREGSSPPYWPPPTVVVLLLLLPTSSPPLDPPPVPVAVADGGRMARTLSVIAVSAVRFRAVMGGGMWWEEWWAWWSPLEEEEGGGGRWLGRRLSFMMAYTSRCRPAWEWCAGGAGCGWWFVVLGGE